jgi:hypothetical protein
MYNSDVSNSGRLKGHKPKSNQDVLDSIALLAVKYDLNNKLLLNAFNRAWINEEFQYGALKIKSLKTDKNTAVIQITFNDEVVWQYPINIDILERPELYESSIPIIDLPLYRRHDSGQKRIGELRAKMRGVSLTARVMEIAPKIKVRTRYGDEIFVTNILLADETGTIPLSLWNSKIEMAVGDTVKIKNASVIKFQSRLQLRIRKSGTINVDTKARE